MIKLLEMKILLPFFCIIFQVSFAQDNVNTLRENARQLLQQGNYDNAIQTLNRALEISPDDLDILKDKVLTYHYKRDFANALEINKQLIKREDADVQSYQLLGMTYKAIASYKDAEKMYEAALKKYPSSGVLYSEFGDLYLLKGDEKEAIKYWENGIKVDPNISSNYYYATKYYAKTGNVIWWILYGEIFVNLESFSARTTEIKNLLLNGYKKLFENYKNIESLKQDNAPFANAVITNFSQLQSVLSDNPTPEAIAALRTRFILNWYQHNAADYRFRLFEFQRQMLREGFFDAYNQWLFGTISNKNRYENWVYTHSDEMKAFGDFQRGILFKIPTGQYYDH